MINNFFDKIDDPYFSIEDYYQNNTYENETVATFETESKQKKYGKIAFGILTPTKSLKNCISWLGGLAIVPSQLIYIAEKTNVLGAILPKSSKEMQNDQIRLLKGEPIERPEAPFGYTYLTENDLPELVIKQIAIKIDGYKSFGTIMGTVNALRARNRWCLISNPNIANRSILSTFALDSLKTLLYDHSVNLIFYDYLGSGESEDILNPQQMIKTHLCWLQFIESIEEVNELIQFGFSIGGGVQAEAFLQHERREHISYLLIKDRTFSRLDKVVGGIANPLMKAFDWSFSPADAAIASEVEQIFEIVLQVTDENGEIVDDGRIPQEAAYLTYLYTREWDYKRFIYIPYEADINNHAKNLPKSCIDELSDLIWQWREGNL